MYTDINICIYVLMLIHILYNVLTYSDICKDNGSKSTDHGLEKQLEFSLVQLLQKADFSQGDKRYIFLTNAIYESL